MAGSHKSKRNKGISLRELLGIIFLGSTTFFLANVLVTEAEAHLIHYFIAGVGAVAGYWIGFSWDRVKGPI